ncbi:pIIIa capsid protein [Psittacine adenovirus 1]|uniref:PIIIa capsid protein n=1 Tax=Psittacine adenovirus 1 TaxID=318592 RepID=A0A2Z5E037_9ADEN|nr:pIIIa capsid protein [Psittacine adenovirus 1]AXB73013.1 pIIIa capsid protein [Psittacine adenovirus 1]
MHPVLQSVRNPSVGGNEGGGTSAPVAATRAAPPHHAITSPSASCNQIQTQARTYAPSAPENPLQHAFPSGDSVPPTCGLAVGAGLDEARMRERDMGRKAAVPEINLFKEPKDSLPHGDYERDLLYEAGQGIDVNRRRVLRAEDFEGDHPDFSPAVNHLKAAELKRAAEQTAFSEEMRNTRHQTRLRTAILRPELPAGIYYLYDFVQTYVDHPDGRVKLNPQLVLVAQHAGNSILGQRLWAIAEDKNSWLRDLIEMAYMIVQDPNLSSEQKLSAVCTTVVELSMKYAKLAAKNGYPSMAQMAKAQEFFYRVMEAILDLGVQVGVYNNYPVRFRQKRMSELPQMTDADYMFGLTQALENRPPQQEDFDSGDSESDSDQDALGNY